MNRILGRLRSILGTSLLGGAVGALFGGSLLGVGALVAPGEVTIVLFALGVGLAGGVGAFVGGAFGTMLALAPRRDLDELSLTSSAAMGGLAGAVFPVVAAVFTGGWLVPLVPAQIGLLSGVFGVLGAGLATGLVAVAKDADPILEGRPDGHVLEGGEG